MAAFTELREMADEGLLQYPYSTRELVNIVKHINVSFTALVLNILLLTSLCDLLYISEVPF